MASADDEAAVRLTVQTDVAQFYYALRLLDAQVEILTQTVAAYQEQVRVLSVQVRTGLIGPVALYQAQAQLEATAAQQRDLLRARADQEHALAILCGQPAPSFSLAVNPLRGTFPPEDVAVPAGTKRKLQVEATSHAFAYVFAGAGKFCNASEPLTVPTEPEAWLDTHPPSHADNRTLVLFDAGDEGIRFLLISGQPLKEPVAWYGPVVMNTQEELRHAFRQLEEGTFLQKDARR